MPMADDGFVPVTRADVTDEAMLAQHVRLLTGEVRDGFATMANRILPVLERLEAKIDDLSDRVRELEVAKRELERAKRDTEDRLAVLEARHPKRKARR